MHFHKAILLLMSLVCVASAAVLPGDHVQAEERSSKIKMTVVNKCKHAFAPVFSPALPGRASWPKLKSGQSSTHTFRSDTYRGRVFSPLRNANLSTGKGATWGEIDLEDGHYDISLVGGYNVPVFVWSQGRQMNGYCTPARCTNANCQDAYRTDSGLMRAARVGAETISPNHSCPPTFTDWVVQFC